VDDYPPVHKTLCISSSRPQSHRTDPHFDHPSRIGQAIKIASKIRSVALIFAGWNASGDAVASAPSNAKQLRT
jgi:hypothetical protein